MTATLTVLDARTETELQPACQLVEYEPGHHAPAAWVARMGCQHWSGPSAVWCTPCAQHLRVWFGAGPVSWSQIPFNTRECTDQLTLWLDPL